MTVVAKTIATLSLLLLVAAQDQGCTAGDCTSEPDDVSLLQAKVNTIDQLQHHLEKTKEENDQLKEELAKLQAELSECKTKDARKDDNKNTIGLSGAESSQEASSEDEDEEDQQLSEASSDLLEEEEEEASSEGEEVQRGVNCLKLEMQQCDRRRSNGYCVTRRRSNTWSWIAKHGLGCGNANKDPYKRTCLVIQGLANQQSLTNSNVLRLTPGSCPAPQRCATQNGNANGAKCLAIWSYGGKTRTGCITEWGEGHHDKPWCYTDNAMSKWGECNC